MAIGLSRRFDPVGERHIDRQRDDDHRQAGRSKNARTRSDAICPRVTGQPG